MFSILIVHYKVPELLKRCLNSLLSADHSTPFEVIIIDNETDSSLTELLKSEGYEALILENSANLGFAKAVNQGIRHAAYPYIVLLNPDAVVDPNAFTALATFFSQYPDAGIAGGMVLNEDHSFQKQCHRRFPSPAAAFFRLFHLHRLMPNHRLAIDYEVDPKNLENPSAIDAVSGSFMCFSKQLVEKIGLLDENYFLFGEDLDYAYRSMQNGYQNYFVPSAVVHHLRGESRKKRKLKTLWNIHHAMIVFYRKHYSEKYNPAFNLLIYIAILSRWIVLLPFVSLYVLFDRFRRP